MNKLFSVIVAGVLSCAVSEACHAKTYQTKNFGVMSTNDIYTVTVGPGTVETRTVVSYKSYTSTVNILQVDLTNPYVTAKAAFADDHKIQDVKLTVPKLMEKHTSYANHYFAGVNADFFGYITCGVTVADGTYVYAGNFLGKTNPFEGTHFIIDKDGLPYIADHIEFGGGLGIRNGYAGDQNLLGEVTFPDGTKYDELRVNSGRWDNCLVLYSPYTNTSTGTNEWGTEAGLKKTRTGNRTIFGNEGVFEVGDMTKSGSGGNMAIPNNGFVLSGIGARNFDNKVISGSRVKVSIPFKADGVANSCRETVGGWPRLVTNDAPLTSVPSNTPSDLQGSSQRARTAVGFSKDRKTLYIVVVEEDSNSTNGMTFMALGNFMQAIGCYNAMALDGGGSSVMHVENLGQRSAVQGVMNGYNRPVMNGLFLVTNAPEDRNVASIEFVDKHLTIKPGKGYVPTIYGYNKYGVLVCTNVTNFTLSASASSVTFNSRNRKMIAPSSGSFTLTAHYNGHTATLPVTVSSSGISGVSPSTTASFETEKMTPVPAKPADWVEPAIYLAGNFNGMKPYEPLVVNQVEGSPDVYEFDIEYKDPLAFKFTTLDPRDNGGWNAFKAGNNGEGFSWHIDNILAPGKEVALVPGNAGNITTPWAGKFHITIDLVKETICVTTTSPRPAIAAPEHLYLIGTLEGHTWDVAYTGAELKGKDGVFTIKNVELTGNDAYFAFTTKADADKDVVNSYPRYGAWKAFEGIPDKTDDFYESRNSWKVAPGEYDITMDFNTGKVKIEPVVEPIYAVLEDITPAGYDWENMEVGSFNARQIPTSISGAWWTAPGGTYSQELMDEAGAVISIHQRGVGAEGNNDELFADLQNGLSIQDLGGYIGKVLVYNQQFGPGANVHGWPYSTKHPSTQISFYMEEDKYSKNPMWIRVRLVFQLLHRGRHKQDDWQIPTIYACAANNSMAWPIKYNGVGDDDTGKKFPIDAKDFYRWENEGTTIAGMPKEKVLLDGKGTPEPWDQNNSTNPYLINAERFMVYEWDLYLVHDGPVGVHFNISGTENRYNTYIFKEIKFFKIDNAAELATQPNSAKRRATGSASTSTSTSTSDSFTTNTASGSLAGTRRISYRYYTKEGVKEIDTYKANTSTNTNATTGIEDVTVSADDDAPVEYYNLQGLRVDNPANGIYIKKQGTRTSKVLFK